MPSKSGTIDERAVAAAGGEVLPGGAGVRVGGWTVTSSKGPIAADAEMESLKAELAAPALPEQCYSANHLCLTHDATGASLTYTAEGALKGWLRDQSHRVHVDGATGWLEARRHEVEAHEAVTMDYDWTFTPEYCGDATTGGGGQVAWAPSAEGLDREMLTSREPILYFDDVPLYESELEDHGTSQMGVKVRVMPRCWYVLLRFFMRVDSVMVRLREVRIFCRLDQQQRASNVVNGVAGASGEAAAVPHSGGGGVVLIREVRHQEGTFEELRRGGAPPQGPAYADAEAAATALMAVAPVGVKRYALERAVL